jgi:hypothetical protein
MPADASSRVIDDATTTPEFDARYALLLIARHQPSQKCTIPCPTSDAYLSYTWRCRLRDAHR